MKRLLSWFIAAMAIVLRLTCSVRFSNDPRPAVRSVGKGCIYAALHAHQVGGAIAGEPGCAAMVSRSADGQLIVPALRVTGFVPIRGSGGVARKGGSPAMHRMIKHVRSGLSAVITVDGPKGPRGKVYPGVALLAMKTDTPVVPLMAIANRRLVITTAWDRLQLPLPFARIELVAGDPMTPHEGETIEAFARRIETELAALERRCDPREFNAAVASRQKRGDTVDGGRRRHRSGLTPDASSPAETNSPRAAA